MARHEQDRWDEERAALLSGGVDGLGGSSGDEGEVKSRTQCRRP